VEELHPITVPSCRAHNEEFHLLDERFRVYLQGCSTSELAARLFAGKTARGLQHRPGLLASISEASEPAIFEGKSTHAIGITAAEHDSFWEKTSRALYFHHYQEPFPGEIRAVCSHFHSPHLDFRQVILLYHSVSPSLVPGDCAHPDVFRYEIGRTVESGGTGLFIRLTFYGDITAFVLGMPTHH
jgi:hypothetical protein